MFDARLNGHHRLPELFAASAAAWRGPTLSLSLARRRLGPGHAFPLLQASLGLSFNPARKRRNPADQSAAPVIPSTKSSCSASSWKFQPST